MEKQSNPTTNQQIAEFCMDNMPIITSALAHAAEQNPDLDESLVNIMLQKTIQHCVVSNRPGETFMEEMAEAVTLVNKVNKANEEIYIRILQPLTDWVKLG